jgi:3-dehydroquinate synthetase
MAQLEEKEVQLAESINQINNSKKLVESKEREVRIIKESNLREKTMAELLSTLNEEKAKTMQNLLESVQTGKLQATFDKYLPAVLNSGTEKKSVKTSLTESVIVEATGDKAAKQEVDMEQRDNVIDIKRLAGL